MGQTRPWVGKQLSEQRLGFWIQFLLLYSTPGAQRQLPAPRESLCTEETATWGNGFMSLPHCSVRQRGESGEYLEGKSHGLGTFALRLFLAAPLRSKKLDVSERSFYI